MTGQGGREFGLQLLCSSLMLGPWLSLHHASQVNKDFKIAYGQAWKITHSILTGTKLFILLLVRASWQYPQWHQGFSAFHAFPKQIFKKNHNNKCWWEYIATGTHTLLAGIQTFTILENYDIIYSLKVEKEHTLEQNTFWCVTELYELTHQKTIKVYGSII